MANARGEVDHQNGPTAARTRPEQKGSSAESSTTAEREPSPGTERSDENRPPLRPRHLGLRLDLIA